MIINIIANLDNQAGLQRDYELLADFLTERGHTVRGVHFNHPQGVQSADLNIFCEHLVPNLMLRAPRNLVFPNPDWWQSNWDAWLPLVERVLVKTHEAASIFKNLVLNRQIFWTGFMSRDFYDPGVERKRAFLHVAGGSRTKNTDAVVAAWTRRRMSVPLTVVAEISGRYEEVHQGCGITFHNRVTEEALRHLYNSHQFFLLPSACEGWSHVLHEAMGCGMVVLTTNALPMSEFGTPPFLLVPATGSVPQGITKAYSVAAADVSAVVDTALSLPPELVQAESLKARKRFLDDNSFFRKRLEEVLVSA